MAQGRSTTFKAILGLIRADGGEVEVFGKKAADLGTEDREQMGVVLSDSGISEYLAVEDLIPVMKNLYTKFDEKSFRERCERFDLPYHKKIKEFLTRNEAEAASNLALSHEAKLLILDEPTAGLDVSAREELLDMLRCLEPGDRSILISSHIATDLEGFCDDIYLINDGKIVLHEDTDVLLGKYGVLKVTEEQYWKIDRKYMIAVRKEEYGYRCLTNEEKQFYLENYPDIVIEKSRY